MDKKLPGHNEQGRTKILAHEPKVKRGAMGLLVSPFKGSYGSAENTPSHVILRKSLASFESAHQIMAAMPCSNAEIIFSGFVHIENGTRQTKNPI